MSDSAYPKPAAPPATHHGQHPAPHDEPTHDSGPKRSWALLAVALAAQILVVLDISVVNTALPSIGNALHLRGSQLAWLVTAYVMMSGGGLLGGPSSRHRTACEVRRGIQYNPHPPV